MERPDSPWSAEAWDQLAGVRHNQLWRDHLLAFAMTRHHESPYAAGFFMLVRHPADSQCAATTGGSRKLLKPDDQSFIDCPLDRLMDIIESAVQDDSHRSWVREFRRRYLDLHLSEEAWRSRG